MYLRRALRGTLTVFFFTILAGIAWYVFRMILARNLTVGEYGLFYAVFSLISFSSMFVDLGLSQAVPKFIVDLNIKKKYEEIKGLLFGVFLFQLIIVILIAAIILLFSNFVSENYFHKDVSIYIFVLLIFFITQVLALLVAYTFIGFQKFGFSASLDLSRVIFLIMSTFLLISLGKGILAPMIGYALVNLFLFLIYFPIILKKFWFVFKSKLKINKKILFSTIKYGFLIALTGTSWALLTTTDTLLLTYFKGAEAVGLYQVAVPIAAIALYLVNAIILVSYPMSAELHTKLKIKELSQGISLFYKYMFLILIPINVLLFSFSDFVISILFGAKFVGANTALQILVLGSIFSSYTLFNNTTLAAIGESKAAAKLMLFTCAINIALCLILIPLFGVVGAAFSTISSFAISATLSAIALRKKVKFKIPVSKWVISFCIGVLTVILVDWLRKIINVNYILEGILILVLSLVFYFFLNLILGVLNFKEIKYLFLSMMK